MTDRDRLIELIKQGENNTPCAENEDIDCTEINCGACVRGGIADYLLANGVIVPPCKVGNTIYKTSILGEIIELKAKSFDCEVITEPYNSIPFSTLNKTLFLTKEEAEEKLRELR